MGGNPHDLCKSVPPGLMIRYLMPRLGLCNRFEDVDPETGIEIKQSFGPPKDIYPIDIVENKAGIQGSCALFKRRTDITKHVRSASLNPLVSLQEAFERFGIFGTV